MKVAAVTGAGSGVGRHTAVALAERGWSVGLIGHGEQSLRQTVELLPDPARCSVHVVDVADATAVDQAAADVVERFGALDAWVGSAATGVFGPVMDASARDIDRVLAVSVSGVINGSRSAAQHMKPVGKGVIVNVGSSLAFTSVPHNVAYGASKAAMRSFSIGLSQELRGTGVVICIAHLPAVATSWFTKVKTLTKYQSRPVGTMHDPGLVGRSMADLVERPRAGDCYLGLSTLAVVLGARAFPRFTAWVAKHGGERLQQTKRPAPVRDNLWSAVEPPAEISPDFKTTHHQPKWWPPLRLNYLQRALARVSRPTSKHQPGGLGVERPAERFGPTDQ